ncbi:HlyD family secretion protein [Sphingobium amiense]|uniref:HlyD family secretion protein n=1 Tax=Sphingobium amiense TaxID=135719 RepID=UPI00350E4E99
MRNSRTVVVISIAAVLVGVLAILAAWRLPPFDSAVQRTDNAYVRGQTTVISPQVSGYVWHVYVQDYEVVRRGQILVKIDDRIYRQHVEQARAALDAARANLANNVQSLASKKAALASAEASVRNAQAQLLRGQADQRRADDLVRDGSLSVREVDQTRAALRQAEAGVAQSIAARDSATQDVLSVDVNRGSLKAAVEGAMAALHAAEIDLENTVVRAPQDGRLGDVGVRAGQYVTNGTQLVFLVPRRLWVTANFKEAQTARMAPGQPAWFTVDALEDAKVRGHVERIAPAAGSEFTVLKPDNATGNFTKVAQRISVRISVDPGQPLGEKLRPGMSVEAHVDTTGARRP